LAPNTKNPAQKGLHKKGAFFGSYKGKV
jgi:hypothetical protein